MVKRVVVGAHYGLTDWLIQRISAVVLGICTPVLALTLLNVVDRRKALDRVARIVAGFGGSPELVLVARREGNLDPAAPPGLNAIVTSRGC